MAERTGLDHVFRALGNPSRRSIVGRLVAGPARVGRLAEPLAMSLPAVMQHLAVLEECGLVHSVKSGRVRTCQIDTERLREAEAWLAHQRGAWESELDSLGRVLADDGPTNRGEPMTEKTAIQSTFTLERVYPVAPTRVFAAWADPDTKARWFTGGPAGAGFELDLRPGGRELSRASLDDGTDIVFESVFHDVVADARIVFSSTMAFSGVVATVSLTTVEFAVDPGGTRLTLNQQGTFLDGAEQPSAREAGTAAQLDALGVELGTVGAAS